MAEVGGSALVRLRGSHGDEVDAGAGQVLRRGLGGEAQATRGGFGGDHLFEAGLVEGRLAGGQSPHLRLIDVDADDLVAEGGHAHCVDGTEVTATNNCHFHGSALFCVGVCGQ